MTGYTLNSIGGPDHHYLKYQTGQERYQCDDCTAKFNEPKKRVKDNLLGCIICGSTNFTKLPEVRKK